jgi:hypothetical protein
MISLGSQIEIATLVRRSASARRHVAIEKEPRGSNLQNSIDDDFKRNTIRVWQSN